MPRKHPFGQPTKICVWVKFTDIINCAKVYLHRLSCFRVPEVQKSEFALCMGNRSYNSVRTNVLCYDNQGIYSFTQHTRNTNRILLPGDIKSKCIRFLQHCAKLALQAALHCGKSVSPSVCHTPVLCQTERTQRDAVFTIRWPTVLGVLIPKMQACQVTRIGQVTPAFRPLHPLTRTKSIITRSAHINNLNHSI